MDIKIYYGVVLMAIMRVAGKDVAKKFDVFFRYHKKIDLKRPKTLRDKVIYIENNCPSPLAAKCTDKWEARFYVTHKGLENILVPVYGKVYSSVNEIDFNALPERFVLKATHGCKMNYFCGDKSKFDINKCKKVLNKWLKETYGTYSGEWHYLDIPHRLYCEQYLDNADNMVDYKFHCFNGEPQFVLVCKNRKISAVGTMKVERFIFDMQWNQIDGLIEHNISNLAPPRYFSEMIKIAKKLSEDFKFVRVDLYQMDEKIYFGELTFTPTNGVFSHYTDEFLIEMGKRLQI